MKQKRKIKLPEFMRPYFWDVDFSRLDPQKNPQYVIERLLEHADLKAVRWVLKNFDRKTIISTLKNRRGFSRKTANFWALYFNIPREEMICFKKGFPNPPVRTWNY